MRRLRASEPIRSLVRETRLDPAEFVLPLFACPGQGIRREIGAMPGNFQISGHPAPGARPAHRDRRL
jgi:porphobilinogen synthase